MAQIESYERCRTERPGSSGGLGMPEEFVMGSPKEEPASIRNLRREVEVYKRYECGCTKYMTIGSTTSENNDLKAQLETRLEELIVQGQQQWGELGSRVTRSERSDTEQAWC